MFGSDWSLRRILFGEGNGSCMNITNGSGFLGQTKERIDKLSKRLFGDSNGGCMNLSTSDGGRGVLGEAMSRIEKLEAEVKTLKNRRSRPQPKRKR